MRPLILLPLLAAAPCVHENPIHPAFYSNPVAANIITPATFKEGSWQHFLQNLPVTEGNIVEYTGTLASNQRKHVAIVNYDVGSRDLQQCADALMRLRAEYLFKQKRYHDIAFHFTSGDLYLYNDFCKGLRPRIQGHSVKFVQSNAIEVSHQSLRRYLDIVYTYAGTISLAKELHPTQKFTVGTVIIKPGSPGHCCMIVDEGINEKGEKLDKLAEGYTPAQSIYILKNPVDGTAWHTLKLNAPLETASYYFGSYQLGVFE